LQLQLIIRKSIFLDTRVIVQVRMKDLVQPPGKSREKFFMIVASTQSLYILLTLKLDVFTAISTRHLLTRTRRFSVIRVDLLEIGLVVQTIWLETSKCHIIQDILKGSSVRTCSQRVMEIQQLWLLVRNIRSDIL
jgi:hypothetical protein